MTLGLVSSLRIMGIHCVHIFSNMGKIMSKDGRLPGSSFMQIRTNFDMCGDMPGGTLTRRPSVAIWKYKGE